MGILEAFATAFLNTFGITQPTEKQRRRAAWFILGMLIVTLSLVVAVGYIFYVSLHR